MVYPFVYNRKNGIIMLLGMTLTELIGQGFGILAVLLGFISFQTETRKKLLLTQCAISVVFLVHYLLIGAYSGLAMNIVSLARNLTYYNQDKLRISQKQTNVLYMVLYVLLGLWRGRIGIRWCPSSAC